MARRPMWKLSEPLGRSQGFWWDWLLARILFREADALVEGAG